MKKQLTLILLMVANVSIYAADLTVKTKDNALVVRPEFTPKSREEIDSEKILNEFLLEYDEGAIQKNYKAAVKRNASLKRIDTALPPRTPDLFASGLFMPYEDDRGIYHDFDRIFFKIKDGNWNLDKKAEASARNSIVFTKESGVGGAYEEGKVEAAQ